jgi:hypothetical protein
MITVCSCGCRRWQGSLQTPAELAADGSFSECSKRPTNALGATLQGNEYTNQGTGDAHVGKSATSGPAAGESQTFKEEAGHAQLLSYVKPRTGPPAIRGKDPGTGFKPGNHPSRHGGTKPSVSASLSGPGKMGQAPSQPSSKQTLAGDKPGTIGSQLRADASRPKRPVTVGERNLLAAMAGMTSAVPQQSEAKESYRPSTVGQGDTATAGHTAIAPSPFTRASDPVGGDADASMRHQAAAATSSEPDSGDRGPDVDATCCSPGRTPGTAIVICDSPVRDESELLHPVGQAQQQQGRGSTAAPLPMASGQPPGMSGSKLPSRITRSRSLHAEQGMPVSTALPHDPPASAPAAEDIDLQAPSSTTQGFSIAQGSLHIQRPPALSDAGNVGHPSDPGGRESGDVSGAVSGFPEASALSSALPSSNAPLSGQPAQMRPMGSTFGGSSGAASVMGDQRNTGDGSARFVPSAGGARASGAPATSLDRPVQDIENRQLAAPSSGVRTAGQTGALAPPGLSGAPPVSTTASATQGLSLHAGGAGTVSDAAVDRARALAARLRGQGNSGGAATAARVAMGQAEPAAVSATAAAGVWTPAASAVQTSQSVPIGVLAPPQGPVTLLVSGRTPSSTTWASEAQASLGAQNLRGLLGVGGPGGQPASSHMPSTFHSVALEGAPSVSRAPGSCWTGAMERSVNAGSGPEQGLRSLAGGPGQGSAPPAGGVAQGFGLPLHSVNQQPMTGASSGFARPVLPVSQQQAAGMTQGTTLPFSSWSQPQMPGLGLWSPADFHAIVLGNNPMGSGAPSLHHSLGLPLSSSVQAATSTSRGPATSLMQGSAAPGSTRFGASGVATHGYTTNLAALGTGEATIAALQRTISPAPPLSEMPFIPAPPLNAALRSTEVVDQLPSIPAPPPNPSLWPPAVLPQGPIIKGNRFPGQPGMPFNVRSGQPAAIHFTAASAAQANAISGAHLAANLAAAASGNPPRSAVHPPFGPPAVQPTNLGDSGAAAHASGNFEHGAGQAHASMGGIAARGMRKGAPPPELVEAALFSAIHLEAQAIDTAVGFGASREAAKASVAEREEERWGYHWMLCLVSVTLDTMKALFVW